jgi:predicted RNase H-like nuclease (RuvC/YqgF family)
VAEVQKVIGQLTSQLEDLQSENSHYGSEVSEVARANERLRTEAAGLKQRIEVLEQNNQRLSAANEVQ